MDKKNKILVMFLVAIFAIGISYSAFSWSEPSGSMPSEYTAPLNTSSVEQEVHKDKGKIKNLNADLLDNYDSSELLAQTGTGYSCPDNYANLCKEGGGLEFVYNGKTLHIDAYPRFAGGFDTGEWPYAQALRQCADIGARIPTTEEIQAACTALGGPNGNGMTSFNNSLDARWEFTSTPGGSQWSITVLNGASCNSFSRQEVNSSIYFHGNQLDHNTFSWFRCVR
ncbi:MAG: hypothetical protein PHY30_00345 [Candidatus Pacebacteria bacterium]|nr:hypothetical protein [Candidatus Paceibacterota bacterium]